MTQIISLCGYYVLVTAPGTLNLIALTETLSISDEGIMIKSKMIKNDMQVTHEPRYLNSRENLLLRYINISDSNLNIF